MYDVAKKGVWVLEPKVLPDGGKYAYDPAIDERLVIIGTMSVINDVVIAVEAFMRQWQSEIGGGRT